MNVFSISALDLFASALGGFILLTVVFMPFFPNTGDSAESIEELQAQIAQMEAEAERQAEAEAELREALAQQVADLEAAARDRDAQPQELPPIDVMILIDTTGSMTNEVDGLSADAVALAEILQGISESAAVGIVGFKDRCDSPTLRVLELRPLTGGNIQALQRFARSLRARSGSCNQDNEEAIGQALSAALRQNWRAEATQQVIVIVSDNGAYPEQRTAVLNAAAQFARSRDGRRVSTVFARTGRSAGGGQYLQQLAESGQGEYVPPGGSFIGSVLKAIVT